MILCFQLFKNNTLKMGDQVRILFRFHLINSEIIHECLKSRFHYIVKFFVAGSTTISILESRYDMFSTSTNKKLSPKIFLFQVSVMIKRLNETITTKYYVLHASLIALGVAIFIAKIVVSV